MVTKDGDSGAKYSANDYFVSLGWGYNDLDRGFFPRAGNKSNLSGKVTLPVRIIATTNSLLTPPSICR